MWIAGLIQILDYFEIFWKHIYASWTITNIEFQRDRQCWKNDIRGCTNIHIDIEYYDENSISHTIRKSINKIGYNFDVESLKIKKWDSVEIRYTNSEIDWGLQMPILENILSDFE